jgi:hypothetical protein
VFGGELAHQQVPVACPWSPVRHAPINARNASRSIPAEDNWVPCVWRSRCGRTRTAPEESPLCRSEQAAQPGLADRAPAVMRVPTRSGTTPLNKQNESGQYPILTKDRC